MPFLKLNSATAFFFSSSGSSRSFDMPAMPTNTMPTTEIRAAATEMRPEGVVNIFEMASWPLSSGGMRVPAAEVRPAPMARPKPTPR